ATVYGIVQQHRGFVTAKSTLGQGSAFEVYLPVAQERLEAEEPDAQSPDIEGRGELILVVEDEEAVRQVLEAILESHNYRLILVGTGREALTAWESRGHLVDLLLTDVVMPDGMSGCELAYRLQQDRPTLKTILCSGYSASVVYCEMANLQHAEFL